ncbi:hypothetical protein AK830_g3539 [Neonectria ditissima]|uniref:EthD domain-containing protein n=1 Tax=Neonectria ditissima TaxID=78410 RepID=A0A0P7BQ16_9HYPO|nr:hypothetical protein AK830_g3539 [Neonectria ditissima]
MPFNKVEHEFTHPQLNYDSTPNFQSCIKVSVFFKKIDSIDYDTFFGHWQTVHADLAVATQAFRKHIVRYCQVRSQLILHNILSSSGNQWPHNKAVSVLTNFRHHQTVEMKERARSLGENVLEYDGCAQLWVRTWDDWLEFYNSKEYAAALSDDCNRFMSLPMTYMVGYENLVVGEGLSVLGGTDGIDTTVL